MNAIAHNVGLLVVVLPAAKEIGSCNVQCTASCVLLGLNHYGIVALHLITAQKELPSVNKPE